MVRVWGVGVVAVTWAWSVPPAHPRGVLGNLGDTPRPPSEGASPLCTPPGLYQVILPMTIRLGRRATCLTVGRDVRPTSHARFGVCVSLQGVVGGRCVRDGERRRPRGNMSVVLPTRPPRNVY